MFLILFIPWKKEVVNETAPAGNGVESDVKYASIQLKAVPGSHQNVVVTEVVMEVMV